MDRRVRILRVAALVFCSRGMIGALCDKTPTPPSGLQLQGVWNVGHTPTAQTGSCLGGSALNILNNDGQTTVSSSGSFIQDEGGGHPKPGTMNLSSGAWSFSGPSGGCGTDQSGTVTASGTCSSSTACSGTYSSPSSP